MKLIKCYINNFGKLSDYLFEFNDDITVIKEDNGFGKSTLCAFIKAMFYGFLHDRSKNLEENERLKFTPWPGGIFGGSLEFLCEKGRYKVERTFGTKSSLDTFLLINLDTGDVSEDFSENLGEELFGIDVLGFERCTLIRDLSSTGKLPLSISSRLSQMVDNTDDLNDYDSAMETLLKRSRQYKTTGNRGIIYDLEREIASLQDKVQEINAAKEQIEQIKLTEIKAQKAKETIQKEIENTRDLISENATEQVVKQKIKHYNSLVASAKSAQEKKETLERKYGGEMFDEVSLNNYSDNVARIENLNKEIEEIRPLNKAVLLFALFGALLVLIHFTLNLPVYYFYTGLGLIIVDFIYILISFFVKKNNKTKKMTELKELEETVAFFFEKFNIKKKDYNEILKEIRADFKEYFIEKAKFEEYFVSAKTYFKQENLKSVKRDIKEKTVIDLKFKEKELTKKYDEICAEILRLTDKKEKLIEKLDAYSDIIYNLETAKEKLNEANENYVALTKGMELLQTAKKNLTFKYKEKIEKNFKENLLFLSDGKFNETMLSNDFDISVIDKGFSHEISSYSSGTKAIIEFSLRLALMTSLFENQNCFVILDDPFVHLDDKSFEKMTERTKELCKFKQIIYFTCANSRTF